MAARMRAARRLPPTPQAEIASPVTVGGVPDAPNNPIAGQPGTTETIRALAVQEYVSAGGYQAYINYARALPQYIDDLTAELGSDLYEQMMLDSQVASVVNVLRSSVLEDGMTFLPAVDDEDDPQHEQAVTYADWCTAVFARLSPKWPVVLWDMCLAFAYGNRVAELVWEVAPDPQTKRPALLLKAVKPKPRESVGFVVDSYNTLLGILAVEVGRAYPVQANMWVTDLDKIPNLLPREKFAVLSFRPENGDPRGTSILRQAYDPWWLAKQARGLHLAFISQVAGPSVIGITPEGAEPLTTDANGNPLDPSQQVSPETAMATQLATLQSGTALAFPFGSEIKPLILGADGGAAFEKFDDRQERRITKAILLQLLATEEGKHQTRAASGTHQDILDTVVRQLRGAVEGMVADDIVRLMLLYNFGEDALELAPVPTLGKTEQHDFTSMAAGIAALESSGYLGQSQKAGVDAMLGLPVRDEEADAQAAAEAMARATALAAADPAQQAAQKKEASQQAGGDMATDKASGAKGGSGATGPPQGKRARPQKQQDNPGAQSGVEGSA